jgi:hypothetical protein
MKCILGIIASSAFVTLIVSAITKDGIPIQYGVYILFISVIVMIVSVFSLIYLDK